MEALLIIFGMPVAIVAISKFFTGMIMGTAEYMAPEQVRGRETDARTDIYALGAVTYHLLAGRPPFMGETPIALGFQHSSEPVPSLGKLKPELPATVVDAVHRALAKTPDERFATVGELRAALLS